MCHVAYFALHVWPLAHPRPPRVLQETVQTLVVENRKVTASPELSVAFTWKSESSQSLLGRRARREGNRLVRITE